MRRRRRDQLSLRNQQSNATRKMLATDSDKNIVIVGAGIIGVCTAYYLALELHKKAAEHHPETIPKIILVEEAESPAPGASGKAAGKSVF